MEVLYDNTFEQISLQPGTQEQGQTLHRHSPITREMSGCLKAVPSHVNRSTRSVFLTFKAAFVVACTINLQASCDIAFRVAREKGTIVAGGIVQTAVFKHVKVANF